MNTEAAGLSRTVQDKWFQMEWSQYSQQGSPLESNSMPTTIWVKLNIAPLIGLVSSLPIWIETFSNENGRLCWSVKTFEKHSSSVPAVNNNKCR